MRNLHIKSLRQFHAREMEMSSVTNTILEKQAELMNEIKSLKKENQQLQCKLANLRLHSTQVFCSELEFLMLLLLLRDVLLWLDHVQGALLRSYEEAARLSYSSTFCRAAELHTLHGSEDLFQAH
ncbi:hypothetical protein ACOSQ3_030635 [Xanthoceras sorbifolium]